MATVTSTSSPVPLAPERPPVSEAGRAPASSCTLPTAWMGQALVDIDGGGNAEVLLMRVNYDAAREHSQSTTFSFLRALPDGAFEQRGDVTFPTPDTQPLAMVAGDLNNDGHADLVVRLEDDLLVFLGRGDFTF